MGNSNYGLDANGNPTIASRDLTRGFRCLGHNSFYYSTYEHTLGNSAALGITSSPCGQGFHESFPSVGGTLDAGEFIVFYITVNNISPVV